MTSNRGFIDETLSRRQNASTIDSSLLRYVVTINKLRVGGTEDAKKRKMAPGSIMVDRLWWRGSRYNGHDNAHRHTGS